MFDFSQFEDMVETFSLVHGQQSLHMLKAMMAVDAMLQLTPPDLYETASDLGTIIITEHAIDAGVPVELVEEAVKTITAMRRKACAG